MQRKASAVLDDRASEWGWFLAWLAVGGCVALGLAALLSVGLVLIVLGALAAVFLLRKGHRNAVVGGITGLSLPLFYLAYLNRGGPGNVCRATAGGDLHRRVRPGAVPDRRRAALRRRIPGLSDPRPPAQSNQLTHGS